VGDPTGAVNVCVTWSESAVDKVFAEGFVREFRRALDDLAATL